MKILVKSFLICIIVFCAQPSKAGPLFSLFKTETKEDDPQQQHAVTKPTIEQDLSYPSYWNPLSIISYFCSCFCSCKWMPSSSDGEIIGDIPENFDAYHSANNTNGPSLGNNVITINSSSGHPITEGTPILHYEERGKSPNNNFPEREITYGSTINYGSNKEIKSLKKDNTNYPDSSLNEEEKVIFVENLEGQKEPNRIIEINSTSGESNVQLTEQHTQGLVIAPQEEKDKVVLENKVEVESSSSEEEKVKYEIKDSSSEEKIDNSRPEYSILNDEEKDGIPESSRTQDQEKPEISDIIPEVKRSSNEIIAFSTTEQPLLTEFILIATLQDITNVSHPRIQAYEQDKNEMDKSTDDDLYSGNKPYGSVGMLTPNSKASEPFGKEAIHLLEKNCSPIKDNMEASSEEDYGYHSGEDLKSASGYNTPSYWNSSGANSSVSSAANSTNTTPTKLGVARIFLSKVKLLDQEGLKKTQEKEEENEEEVLQLLHGNQSSLDDENDYF